MIAETLSRQTQIRISFLQQFAISKKNMMTGNRNFSNQNFQTTEMLCVYSKNYCCYDNKTDKFKFSSKGLNKRVLEDYGSMSKYMTVLNGAVNLTSTNIGSRTVTLMDATYEHTKKGLFNFYPRRQVHDD